MSLELEDRLVDALDAILALDLPDEACAEALVSRAGLLAGIEPEDL